MILGRWLSEEGGQGASDRRADPRHRCRAKSEIYEILYELAAQGMAIVVISSELPEGHGDCGRILVMCEGRIAAEIDRSDFDEHRIPRSSTFRMPQPRRHPSRTGKLTMTTSLKKNSSRRTGPAGDLCAAFVVVSLTVPNSSPNATCSACCSRGDHRRRRLHHDVLPASRDFDLSSLYRSLLGMVAVMASNATGSIVLGLLAALACGGIVGLANGVVIARFRINALITTLATMQIVRASP